MGVEYDMVMFVCTTSSLWVETIKDGVKLPFLFVYPYLSEGMKHLLLFEKGKHFIFSR